MVDDWGKKKALQEKARENVANFKEFKPRWPASQGTEGTWKATT